MPEHGRAGPKEALMTLPEGSRGVGRPGQGNGRGNVGFITEQIQHNL
jgi:hypothetical protein